MTFTTELGIGNGARPYNFDLQLVMPTALGTNASTQQFANILVTNTTMPGSKINTREFYMNGRSVKIPGTIQQDQLWTCTFYLDDEYFMRTKIENWISLIDNYFLSGTPTTGSGLIDIVMSKADSYIQSAVTSFLGNVSINDIKNSQSIGDGLANTSKYLASSLLKNLGVIGSGASAAITATATVTQKSYTGSNIATCTMHNLFPIEISPIQFNNDGIDQIGTFTVTFAYSYHEFNKQNNLLTNVVNNIL